MPKPAYRLCLNMIVRDEAHVIRECLDSVAAYIDYWIICDTGSVDDTPAIIEAYFAEKSIPGELHHHDWENFGRNRSLALQLVEGKAEYAWVIDADDYLVGSLPVGRLSHDTYELHYRESDECHYWRRQIFRMALPWRYLGVVHEYADCDAEVDSVRLEGDYHVAARRLGGARNSDSEKYARDAALLEAEHARNPQDRRTVFYLAQSYFDHGNMPLAEHWYRKRSGMGGWEEEVFYSKLRIALILEKQESSFSSVRSALLNAWEYRPTRAEPLYHLARLCRLEKAWHQAYLFATQAVATPLPEQDSLFVDNSVWLWRALDELSIAAYWVGRYSESKQLCEKLLSGGALPESQVERVKENLAYARKHTG